MLMEVPDGIARRIQAEIDAADEIAVDIERLNTEENIDWFIKKYARNFMAVTRQSTYDTRHDYRLCFHRFTEVNDPPVIMRGSRYRLHRRYCKSYYGTAPNGWHERVVCRYLKMIKFTSLGFSWEHRNQMDMKRHISIQRTINMKYGHQGFNNPCAFGRWYCYINGEEYFINPEHRPMLKSILRHIHKLKNIDRAMERLH